METRDQKAAQMVLDNVRVLVESAARGGGGALPGKYRTLCKKFGGLVRNAGLVSAAASLCAGGEKHHEALLEHLRLELAASSPFPPQSLGEDSRGFLSFIVGASAAEYMTATRHVLRLLYWHRQVVETLVRQEEEED